MMEKTGRRTVPQIYIGDTHVGGYDDLAALERAGRLDEMLRAGGEPKT
jgi:glutaredoxin 3